MKALLYGMSVTIEPTPDGECEVFIGSENVTYASDMLMVGKESLYDWAWEKVYPNGYEQPKSSWSIINERNDERS